MKECALCTAAIEDSATVCGHCGQQVIVDSVAVSPFAAPAEEAAAASAAPAPSRARLSQRELLAGACAAVAVAVVTLGLLMLRGSPSSEVAAAHAEVAAPAPAALPVKTPANADSIKWNVGNRAYWTGNQRNSAAFELHAENMVEIWMRQVRPLLVVRCMSNRTEAFVITDSALKIEPQTDDHTVTFSFDNEAETKERWQDAADHNALFAPDGIAFTQRLTRATTLRFGYTPHNVAPVAAEFTVNGLGPLVEPVSRQCGWAK